MAILISYLGAVSPLRWTVLLAAFACASAVSPRAYAVSIETVIDRATGEVFLKNPNTAAETLDGYSFYSPGFSLLTTNLDSISANYDASGDQSVDSAAEWFFLSMSSETISEASSVAMSGVLDPGEIVSLGNIWSVGDLEALFVTLSAGVTTTDAFGEYRDLEADFDNDLDVDMDDLAVYNATYGSTTLLNADANGDSIVDAADYTIWREAFDLSLTTATTAPESLPPFSIPEPSGGGLLISAAVWGGGRRRGRQGATRRA